MKKIDEKEVKAILNAFDNEDEMFLPEGLKLDDLQEQFVRGYLCAQQEQNGGAEKGEEKIRQRILQVPSKYCGQILNSLSEEGELYHGDLAEKLQLSPSGLNAIIKKMMDTTPPIIEMKQVGKYKIYSLPDEIKRYMANRSQSGGDGNHNGKVFHENVLLTLQHFVEAAGENWKDVLNLLLQGEKLETGEVVGKCFLELVAQARQAEDYDGEMYDAVKKAMKNDILSYLLDEYVAELKECDMIMEEIRLRENGNKLIRHFKMQ